MHGGLGPWVACGWQGPVTQTMASLGKGNTTSACERTTDVEAGAVGADDAMWGCRFPELHRVAGRQIDVFSVGSATRRALSGGGAVDGLLDYGPAGPRQPVGGLWTTRAMLRGRLWPSVRASELGWGVGGGRACVNDAGPGYSTCGLGSRRPVGARMGHCAQIGWAREGGMACYLDRRARQVRNESSTFAMVAVRACRGGNKGKLGW